MTYTDFTPDNSAVRGLISGGSARVRTSGAAFLTKDQGTYEISLSVSSRTDSAAPLIRILDSGATSTYAEVKIRCNTALIVDNSGTITADNLTSWVTADSYSYSWQVILPAPVGEWILQVTTASNTGSVAINLFGLSILELEQRPAVDTTLTKPSAYPVTPLISPVLTRHGWTGSVSAKSLRNASGVVYYVDITNGSDANPGTAANAPLKSIEIALEKADVGTVKVAPGIYRWGNTWGTPTYVIAATAGYNVERWPVRPGQVYVTTAANIPSWSVDGTYANVYRATATFSESVVDLDVPVEGGGYLNYDEATTLLLCSAQPGSWFWDSGTNEACVNPLRRGVPSDSILVLRGFNAAVDPASRRQVYIDGLTFIGGDMGLVVQNNTVTAGGRLVARRCNFVNCVASGFSGQGFASCVMEDCVAAQNGTDGIGHIVSGTNGLTNGTEIRCVSNHNGKSASGDTDNGFTIHDGMAMTRIACSAIGNVGPQFADTGTATKVWMVGCYAGQSAAFDEDTQSAGFHVLADTTTWLHDCASRTNLHDLVVVATGAAYRDRCSFAVETNAGTMSTYSQL